MPKCTSVAAPISLRDPTTSMIVTASPSFVIPGWEVKVGATGPIVGDSFAFSKTLSAYTIIGARSSLNVWMADASRSMERVRYSAVAGREKEWRNSLHKTDDPLLIWNAESGQEARAYAARGDGAGVHQHVRDDLAGH